MNIEAIVNGFLRPDQVALIDGKLVAGSREAIDRVLAWYNEHVVQTDPPFVLLDDGTVHELADLERMREERLAADRAKYLAEHPEWEAAKAAAAAARVVPAPPEEPFRFTRYWGLTVVPPRLIYTGMDVGSTVVYIGRADRWHVRRMHTNPVFAVTYPRSAWRVELRARRAVARQRGKQHERQGLA